MHMQLLGYKVVLLQLVVPSGRQLRLLGNRTALKPFSLLMYIICAPSAEEDTADVNTYEVPYSFLSGRRVQMEGGRHQGEGGEGDRDESGGNDEEHTYMYI